MGDSFLSNVIDVLPLLLVLWLLISLGLYVKSVMTTKKRGVGPVSNPEKKSVADLSDYGSYANVAIPDVTDKTGTIDRLIVSAFGLFVIKYEDVQGEITGGKERQFWSCRHGGEETSFKNPLHQNSLQIWALAKLLGIAQPFFHSVVVFGNRTVFAGKMPENVLRPDQLVYYLLSFQKEILTPMQIKVAVHRLKLAAPEPIENWHEEVVQDQEEGVPSLLGAEPVATGIRGRQESAKQIESPAVLPDTVVQEPVAGHDVRTLQVQLNETEYEELEAMAGRLRTQPEKLVAFALRQQGFTGENPSRRKESSDYEIDLFKEELKEIGLLYKDVEPVFHVSQSSVSKAMTKRRNNVVAKRIKNARDAVLKEVFLHTLHTYANAGHSERWLKRFSDSEVEAGAILLFGYYRFYIERFRREQFSDALHHAEYFDAHAFQIKRRLKQLDIEKISVHQLAERFLAILDPLVSSEPEDRALSK